MSSTSFATRRPVTVERTIGGKTISIETGRLAKQASGAVVVRLGDTMTLVATVGRPRPRRARLLPAHRRLPREDLRRGQVPRRLHQARRPADHQGNPHLPADRPADPPALPRVVPRRSPDPGRPDLGRPAERPRRPLDDRRLGRAAARPGPVPRARSARSGSAGSTASSSPFPTADELERATSTWSSPAPTKADRDDRGLRREMPEAEMLDAIMIGPPASIRRSSSSSIELLRSKAGLPPKEPPPRSRRRPARRDALRTLRRRAPRAQADRRQGRPQRRDQGAARSGSSPSICPEGKAEAKYTPAQVKAAFYAPRGARRPRADPRRQAPRRPRPASDLRPINCEVGVLPRAHGSAIFQRGETQALVTTVLGHRRRRAAGRRHHGRVQQEVHARLQLPAVRRRRGPADPRARPPRDRPRRPGRAVASTPSCPTRDKFPYTIRVVSDILESNGSSSMASVCGGDAVA